MIAIPQWAEILGLIRCQRCSAGTEHVTMKREREKKKIILLIIIYTNKISPFLSRKTYFVFGTDLRSSGAFGPNLIF